MRRFQAKQIIAIRAGLLFLSLCLAAGGLLYTRPATAGQKSRTTVSATPPRAKKTATPRPKTKPTPVAAKTPAPATTAYTDFPHSKHPTDCASCHKFPSSNWEKVREKDAFPDVTEYPHHESCLKCHREQFFNGSPPAICSICHVSPSPDGGPRYPFPNPRETFDKSPKAKTAVSDFQIFFPHDKHLDLFGRNDGREYVNGTLFVTARYSRPRPSADSDSCANCHQTYQPQGDSSDEYVTKPPASLGDAYWLKKGTFKTAPIGHTTCFTCHSTDSGLSPAPTDCGTCHKPAVPLGKTDFDAKTAAPMGIEDRIMLLAWRKRDSAAVFRHEFFSHTELSCATCHNAAAMNTLDPATKKVKLQSCGGDGTGCHITPTLDDGGILNYEIDQRQKNAKFECVKCHLAFGKEPIPETHLKAISASK
ncbi:MAG: hypothetical protein JSS81_17150 [Acidobacteria bacterium]|nr:hypothetical protein [Acidobacteriota bacterium]